MQSGNKNTTKSASSAYISAGNLDRTDAMAVFLKQLKIVSELNKGVKSMKRYVYPSILQKQAIPAIKSSDSKNVIVHYQEFTGVKLTFLLPVVDHLLKTAIAQEVEDSQKPLFVAILCHSYVRC